MKTRVVLATVMVSRLRMKARLRCAHREACSGSKQLLAQGRWWLDYTDNKGRRICYSSSYPVTHGFTILHETLHNGETSLDFRLVAPNYNRHDT